jgi:hypothetical protein
MRRCDGHYIRAYSFADSNSSWQCGAFRKQYATIFKIVRNVGTVLDFEHCDSNKPDKL